MIHKMISYYERRNAELQEEVGLMKGNVEYFRNKAGICVRAANYLRNGAASSEFRKKEVKKYFSRAAYYNHNANKCVKRVTKLVKELKENQHKIEELNERTYRPYC